MDQGSWTEALFIHPSKLSPAERNDALARFIASSSTYFSLVAERELPAEVRANIDPSDIFQDSYIEAQRDFKRFHGTTDRELLAWFCEILRNNARDHARRFH
jgi:DNA-directed RNA polymerase specialized sigma24 family protein